ncbi:MAG: hypothetical protein JW723_10125 [Bacteroidales bacterium]|nr:hypothetical protein [Bacteroidales bacterium]
MKEEYKNIEFIDQEQERKEIRSFSLRDLLDGSILTRNIVVQQLPFIFFLTLLAVIYISNRYHAERTFRKVNEIQIEVKNLRAEQITTTAKLMNISKPSAVSRLVEERELELKELSKPPVVLTKKKKNR